MTGLTLAVLLPGISWILLQLKTLIYSTAHLSSPTPTAWHLLKPPIRCYLTLWDVELFFARRRHFPRHPPSHFSYSSLLAHLPLIVSRYILKFSTFLSFFLSSAISRIRQADVIKLRGATAGAAYIVQFSHLLPLIQVRGEEGQRCSTRVRITLTSVEHFGGW